MRMEESGAAAKPPLPYFTFGVVADVQYADRPNGLSAWKTMRYHRQSLQHLQQAIEEWNGEMPLPRFVLQLGDLIDGSNQRSATSGKALETVLSVIERAKMPFHHVWGNHELYNFQRGFLRESKLNTTWMQDRAQDGHSSSSHDGDKDGSDYYAYHFSPRSKFRFIVIDTYDLSFLGRNPQSRGYLDSMSFLDQLGQYQRHLTEFNGGLGKEQLTWLEELLAHCDRHGERAIVAGHCPIHPAAKGSLCLAWNYKDVLAVVQSHSSVVCYFAGHDHSGGYYQDSAGIHHVTMQGVIESPPEQNAFATLEVYEDKMVLSGRGRVKSRLLPFRTWHQGHTGDSSSLARPLQDTSTNQM